MIKIHVRDWNEVVSAVLKNACGKDLGEGLGGRMQLEEHGVTLTYVIQVYDVGVEP